MKACMEENGMKFDEKEIEDLVSERELSAIIWCLIFPENLLFQK